MTDHFTPVYQLMEQAFPDWERRSEAGQRALLSDDRYRLLTRQDTSGNLQGFLAVWDFSSFLFLEHFAVDASLRSQGLGRQMLQQLIGESSGKLLVCEVEPAETPLAARRIGFYERQGFCLNPYRYLQPPLQAGMPWGELRIMSHPRGIGREEFEFIRHAIYQGAYGLPEEAIRRAAQKTDA